MGILRAKIFSLIIPEPQEMIPFPKSFGLHFQPIFFRLYQESQENSKIHKLKQKKLLDVGAEVQEIQKSTAFFSSFKGNYQQKRKHPSNARLI